MLMNNKTIILGTVNLDWHFAKGCFKCNCANTEDVNAFDRVICGILYRNGNYMQKSELATLIGFNIVDNPLENLYCDRSEKAIFDTAVSSLVEYGLIVDDNVTLRLTDTGRVSVETRTKQRIEIKDIELWISEYTDSNFNYGIIKELSARSVDLEVHPTWNILNSSPLEVLQIQRSALVNAGAGKSVSSMNCISMNYYVVDLKCKICYDLQTQQLFVCSSTNSIEIDGYLLTNKTLQTQLLDKFFSEQNKSVIYKQSYQEEKEKFILQQETENNSSSDIISCKDDFLPMLKYVLADEKASTVFFNLQIISEETKNYLKQINDVAVCVDYLSGIFDEIQESNHCIIEDSISYYRVEVERTNDLCVCGDTSYTILPYIVDYKGICYNIPLVYKNEDKKYIQAALFAPFVDHILDNCIRFAQRGLASLKKNPTSSLVNNVINKCIYLERLNLQYENDSSKEKANMLGQLVQQVLTTWNNIIRDKLSNLEAEIIAGGDEIHFKFELKKIELDVMASTSQEEDILSHISEIKKRINNIRSINTPKIELQSVYILDTSIFMDMPKVLDKFNLVHDRVIVPRAMEQELDSLTHVEEKKNNATMARLSLRSKMSDYPHFISIKDNVDRSLLPVGFDPEKKDNDMLATAIEFEQKNNIDKVIVVSNDAEFISNIKDCVASKSINENIEGINLNELLIRLGD